MGEAARRVFLERTSPGERFDIGLELAEEAMQAAIEAMDIPEDLTDRERARFIIQRLSKRGM